MTRAPRSASCRVAKGPETACSRAMTVMLWSGSISAALRPGSAAAKPGTTSKRPRHFQNVLTDVREDQVCGDRRDLVKARLANLAYDGDVPRQAANTRELQAVVGGIPRRPDGEVECHGRLRAFCLVRSEP